MKFWGFFLIVLLGSSKASAENFLTAEYKLPARVDPDVLADRATEMWAQIYLPQNQNKPAPLVLFLHGNHGTCGKGQNPRVDDNCEYTHSGTCPKDYVVTPNHLGFSYLAEKMASQGLIVVSVNANRGITCGGGGAEDFGLNLARGRLLLKHLQTLSQWNRSSQAPKELGLSLSGRIDFSRVGLMGHSRGGEGARAAYQLYYEANSPWRTAIAEPVNIRAIFEIGPVDGQTRRELNPLSTAWAVLLPMCDGDVSDLQGMNPYDRMLKINREERPSSKSTLTVWGTNHNFYNSEWHQSDSFGCRNHEPLWEKPKGAEIQRWTAEVTLIPFFKEKLLSDNADLPSFMDPVIPLPQDIASVTRIDRNFVATVDSRWTSVFDVTSLKLSQHLQKNIELKNVRLPAHPSDLKGLHLKWSKRGDHVYFQVPLSSEPVDLSDVEFLSFRLNRSSSDDKIVELQNFSLRLVDRRGKMSESLLISDWAELTLPADHGLLFTVKIPMESWRGAFDSSQVVGLRLIFNQTRKGQILITQPTLQKRGFQEDLTASIFELPQEPQAQAQEVPRMARGFVNRRAMKAVVLSERNARGQMVSWVEVDLGGPIPVRNALPVLKVGERIYKTGRFPQNGRTDRMIFELDSKDGAWRRQKVPVEFYFEGDAQSVLYQGSVGRAP